MGSRTRTMARQSGTAAAADRRRGRLMRGTSAAAAAAVLALAPQPAAAQEAFQADFVGATGAVGVSRSATVDTVTVNSAEAIIDWAPFDTTAGPTPIVVLPGGNTLAFTGNADFTVLNRIIPADQSRAIQFDGNVVSTVQGQQGGNIWFYSPGGIILGSSAVFNVGSLLLTTTDLDTGNGLANGNAALILGNVGGGAVSIQPGASVNAGNYVVAWAPLVEQNGTVDAAGNIGYIGAEQGFLTFNGGLLDITVAVGTDDAHGVVHGDTGTTTGPTGAVDEARGISMVAVPKNTFLNMLVGGNIGYREAATAGVVNGVIVLQAGDTANNGSLAADIDVAGAAFTSEVQADATGSVSFVADGAGSAVKAGSGARPVDLTVNARDSIAVSLGNGGGFEASGDAFFSATDGNISIAADAASAADGVAIGGELSLKAESGLIENNAEIAAGGNIAFDALGDIGLGTLVSQNGEIVATSDGTISFDSLTAANDITLDALGAVQGSDLLSTAGTIGLTADGDIAVLHAEAGDDFLATGQGAFLTGPNSIVTGGDIAIDVEGPATLGNSSAGGLVDVEASQIDFDTLAAGQTVALQTVPSNDPATGGNGDITGTSITAGPGASSVTSGFGSVAIGGASTIGGSLDVAAAGDAGIGSVAVQGGSLTVNAGSAITYTGASATDAVVMTAPGPITGGDIAVGGLVRLLSTQLGIGVLDIQAGGAIDLDAATDIAAEDLTAATGIAADAGGNIGLATAQTGANDIALTAGGSVSATGDVATVIDAATGAVFVNAGGDGTFDGDIAAADVVQLGFGGGLIAQDLFAGQGIEVETVDDAVLVRAEAQNGAVNFNVGGDIAGAAISNLGSGAGLTGDDVTLNAGGDIDLSADSAAFGDYTVNAGGAVRAGDFVAGGTLDIAADDVAISAGIADTIAIDSANDILFDLLRSPNAIGLVANNGSIGANTGAGDIDSDGDVTLLAQTIAIGDILSGGSVDAQATAGDASFGTVEAANAIAIAAVGTPSVAEAISGGDTTITGQSVSLDNGTIGGDLTLDATAGDIDGNGTVTVGGGIDFDATGDVGFGSLDAQGGDFTVDAGGAIAFVGATAAGLIDFDAAGAITGEDIEADGGVDLASSGGGDIAVTGMASGADIAAQTGGSFTAGTVAASQAGSGQVAIAAAGGIAIDVLTGNDATLDAAGGAVAVAGDIDIAGQVAATGRSVLLRSTNDLTAGAQATAGDVDVATTGNLTVLGANASGDVLLGGANVTLADDANAADLLDIDAAGVLAIQAGAQGADIDILAGDIALAAGGALGSAATRTIAIASNGDILLGGAGGSGAGFELDNAEAARIASGGSVTVSSLGGNMTVDDLDVVAGQGGQIATGGVLNLAASADMLVIGGVTVAGGTADTGLALTAGNTLRIDTAAGNLRVEDANGTATGAIALAAQQVLAVSDAALADIAGAAVEDIDARLAENDGVIRDEGFIQASALTIAASAGVFIQNSGAGDDFADRRGFAADTLTIAAPAGAAGVPVAINGVVGGLTGIDAIGAAQVGLDFDALSTINGCVIADPVSCTVVNVAFADQSRDLIEEEIRADGDGDGAMGGIDSVLIAIRDGSGPGDDPLIDDPVTGAGNEDLWAGDRECDEAADDSGLCPSDEGEPQ